MYFKVCWNKNIDLIFSWRYDIIIKILITGVRKMKNILIYDDNIEHCLELKMILHDQLGTECTNIDTAVSYAEAQKLLSVNTYDIFFIDIELDNRKSGIDFTIEFQKKYPNVSIVYITAHIKYCQEIFLTSPTAFLLKPFTHEGVSRTLRIIKQKRSKKDYLIIHTNKNTVQKICFDDIAYIENISRKLVFFNKTYEPAYEFYGIKISEIEPQFPDYFLRCHHSICINLDIVESIKRYQFTLKGDKQISISQSKFKSVKQAYVDFLGGKL